MSNKDEVISEEEKRRILGSMYESVKDSVDWNYYLFHEKKSRKKSGSKRSKLLRKLRQS